MKTGIDEYMEAINAAKMVLKLDIATERKLAVLEEIKNALPVGMVAGAFKQTSVIVQDVINGFIGELRNGGGSSADRAKANPPAKEAAKA